MTRTPLPARGGSAGLWFLFCFAVLVAGVAFDVLLRERPHFWIGDIPGAAAAIGVGAAIIVALGARALRALFGRKSVPAEGET